MSKRRRTLNVAKLNNQVKEEVKRDNEKGRNISRLIQSLNHAERIRLAEQIKKTATEQVDIGYIRTVLFPEVYSYDIPQPLTNLSYSRFTDSFQTVVSTCRDGAQCFTQGTTVADSKVVDNPGSGSGMLIWYPQVNQGPSLFMLCNGDGTEYIKNTNVDTPAAKSTLNVVTLPTAQSDTTLSGDAINRQWRVGDIQNYETFFSQTCLVSASIQIQYTGQLEQESGLMVGSHLYGIGLTDITLDDIETGQYKAMGRPTEGLRFVYLPKDNSDYEYYPTNKTYSHNAGSGAGITDEQNFILGDNSIKSYDLKGNELTLGKLTYTGAGQCIAIYWKGLPTNGDWLRIDITRKFNGVPKQPYRDIVEVSRCIYNFDEKKTFDVLRNMSLSIPIGGHTFRGINLVKQAIMLNMENVVALNNAGALRNIDSLVGFAQALEQPEAVKTGLIGQPTADLDRIYDY